MKEFDILMSNSVEVFKDIPGFEGRYQVSNHGRVKSLKRREHQRESFMQPILSNNSYYMVNLSDGKKTHQRLLHRVVAEVFCYNPDPSKYKIVDHIDTDKLNNHADNLRWVNQSINMRVALGRKVVVKDTITNTTTVYKTIPEAAAALGITAQNIRLRVKKGFYKHYQLKYGNEKKTSYIRKLGRPIYQYDKSGNLVAEYKSISEAVRQTGWSYSSILHALNKITATSHGYVWEYKN